MFHVDREKLYFLLDDNGLRAFEKEVKDPAKPGETKEAVTFTAGMSTFYLYVHVIPIYYIYIYICFYHIAHSDQCSYKVITNYIPY